MEQSGEPDEAISAPLTARMRIYRCVMIGTGVIAAVLFAAMALLVCADVFLRNIGAISIPWSVEVTEYMLMVAAFLAAPWLVYTNDHIRVDVLLRGLPDMARRIAGVLGDVICLLVCLALTYQSIVSTVDSAQQGGLVFKVLVFPDWWLGLPMLLSFVLLTVEFVRRLALVALRSRVA